MSVNDFAQCEQVGYPVVSLKATNTSSTKQGME